MSNTINNNFSNTNSFEYKFLERLVKRDINNDTVSAIVAEQFNGSSSYADTINHGDVRVSLHEFSPNSIKLNVQVFLSPSDYFAINSANLREKLKNDPELSKPLMTTKINRLLEYSMDDYYAKIPLVKRQIIQRIVYLYSSSQAKSAVEIYLDQALKIGVKLTTFDDDIKTFVNDQHRKANIELNKMRNPLQLTLEDVIKDLKLKEQLSKGPIQDHGVFKTEQALYDDLYELLKPQSNQIAGFIANNHHLNLSKEILKQLQKDVDRTSDGYQQMDILSWDTQRLMTSIQRFIEHHPDMIKETIHQDLPFSRALFESHPRIHYINKTDQYWLYFMT